ncbi:hypothetical protein AB0N71_13435 [Pseudarthrobacter enclensis]|uniref:hypothetical protein n=1 Tax=Pseudarthrobacter enclensis TaxID=993070 RepID=UPI00342A8FC8
MSQEQPPIRSRRELRKARDAAQKAAAAPDADQLSPATKTPPAAPAAQPAANVPAGKTPVTPTPADEPGKAPAQRPGAAPGAAREKGTAPAVGPAQASGTARAAGPQEPGPASQPGPAAAPAQRSSQIRARDRATLRTIKELEEKEGQLAAGGPPTRRQLRLQQLKEQALTAATPIVPAAPETPAPAAKPGVAGKTPATPAPAKGKGTKASGERPAPSTPAPSSPAPSPSGPEGMTVEQALAARALIAEQAKNQIAKMEHIASLDPEAVDPDILAEQIALAERAAVMNRRAMARQKLAEQAGGSAAVKAQPGDAGSQATAKEDRPKDRPGPSTANNLAMVTPLEFVQVPGVDRPVMKPPATSHVPVTTRPGTKVPPGGGSKRRPGSKPAAPRKQGPAPDPVSGRSQVIARAEAAARAATRPKPVVLPDNQAGEAIEDLPRVPASSAYGLEPLDAATAGLGRARRNRILQVCILAFGVVALVSGVVLIISGMNP